MGVMTIRNEKAEEVIVPMPSGVFDAICENGIERNGNEEVWTKIKNFYYRSANFLDLNEFNSEEANVFLTAVENIRKEAEGKEFFAGKYANEVVDVMKLILTHKA